MRVHQASKICKAICFSMLMFSSALAAEDIKKVIDDPAYTHAQRLVEVEPGRRLNLYCLGEGTPTVVFEAGQVSETDAWARVQPAIAAHARACSYDRAGLGYSDPSRRPGDSANIVDDLHRLLKAASINPPYILVGHSLGGMHVRLYADTYLDEVAGMVLVDSAEETWRENWWRLDPTQPSHRAGLCIGPEGVGAATHLHQGGGSWLRRKDPTPTRPALVLPGPTEESDAINAAYMKAHESVGYQQAKASEDNSYQHASSDEVSAARRWYGDMPLIVLTSTPRGPRKDETQAFRDALNRVHAAFADQLAALSKRGVVRPVPNSTHDIQDTQPQSVIDAILEVLQDARAPKEQVQQAQHPLRPRCKT